MAISFAGCEKSDVAEKKATKPTSEDSQIALQKLSKVAGHELKELSGEFKASEPFFQASVANSRGSLYWLDAWFNYSSCLPSGHGYWLKYWVYNWNTGSWQVMKEDGGEPCLTDFYNELHTMYDGRNIWIKVYVEAWDWGTEMVYLGYAQSEWLFLPDVIL